MQTSLKYLSFFLVLSLLASCAGGLSLNCNEDEVLFKRKARTDDVEEMSEIFYSKNIDINESCEKYATALINAACIGNLESVRWLLRNGADPNIRNHRCCIRFIEVRGPNSRNYRTGSSSIDVYKLIESREVKNDPAFITNEVNEVNRGGEIWTEYKHYVPCHHIENRTKSSRTKIGFIFPGDTALISAIRKEHITVIQELLNNGAHCDVQNSGKETAVHVAIRINNEAILSSLVKAGANLNILNKNHQTALMIAIEKGHKDIALALIAEKARGRINLDVKDSNKRTALYYTRNGSGKNKEIENALLEYGAEEYLLSKQIKKGAKSLFFKAAEKAPEAGATALL